MVERLFIVTCAYSFMKYRLRAADAGSTGFTISGTNRSAVSMICSTVSIVPLVNSNNRMPLFAKSQASAGD